MCDDPGDAGNEGGPGRGIAFPQLITGWSGQAS